MPKHILCTAATTCNDHKRIIKRKRKHQGKRRKRKKTPKFIQSFSMPSLKNGNSQSEQKEKKINYVIPHIKSVDEMMTFSILDIILLDNWLKKKKASNISALALGNVRCFILMVKIILLWTLTSLQLTWYFQASTQGWFLLDWYT